MRSSIGPPAARGSVRRSTLALLLAIGAALAGVSEAGAAQTHPNVVVVMTDDQRLYEMEAMPLTNRLIGEQGVTFENSFVTYSLCCPSRATFLSGQYAHNHGVLDNDLPEGGYEKFDFSNALGVWLQEAGYRTAHVGKQLNEYGVAYRPLQPPVAPGYHDWFATRDPTTYSMYNYVVQDNLVRRPYGVTPKDYQTDVLADRAVENIRRWAPDDRPFFVHLSTSVVHHEMYDAEDGPRPAPRHVGSFADHEFEPRPNYDEADVSDKPSMVRRYKRISPDLAAKIAREARTRLEALQAVDEAVARIVAELERAGELEQTLIVFTSDNGYFAGEHRIPNQKVAHYEESTRVPLLVRGPGFPAGETRRQLVANVDLAPTIVELAGATPGRVMDGESLLPFAGSPGHRRARALALQSRFHAVGGPPALIIPAYHQGVNVYFDGIRTRRFKYIHWFRDVNGDPADEEELYDLAADPYELQSLHESPRHRALKRALKREVATFKDCAGRACVRKLSAVPACVRGPLRVRSDAIGRLAVGVQGEELLPKAGSPGRARGRAWRYCVREGASRRSRSAKRRVVRAALSPEREVRLVATTAATRGTRGVRRGSRLARLRRAYPAGKRIARGLRAADRRSGLVFGVSRGRVRFVAVADLELRKDPPKLARYVRLIGL